MSEKNNRKLFDNLVSRTKIYLVIIFILLVVLSYLKTSLIIPSIIIYIMILGYTYFANNKRRSEISEQLQDLTLSVDSAAKSSLINAPFPLLILETDGNIIWKSSKFITEFANIDINNYISDLIIDIKSEIEKNKEQKRKSIIKNIEIGKKQYKVQAEFAKTKKSERKKVAEYNIIDGIIILIFRYDNITSKMNIITRYILVLDTKLSNNFLLFFSDIFISFYTILVYF